MSARGTRKCLACERKRPVKTVRRTADGWVCKASHQCIDAYSAAAAKRSAREA